MIQRLVRLNFRGVYLILILTLTWGYCWRQLASQDLYNNAAIGGWVWAHKQLPRETLFLWTAHQPWIAHSWLGDLCFYAVMANGGIVGNTLALLLTTMLCWAVLLLLWNEWERHGGTTILMPIAFGLALQCSGPRLEPRADRFSDLCLAIILVLLLRRGERNREERHLRDILVFVPLFAVWANLHGGVALGMVLVVLTAACEWAQDKGSPRARGTALLAVLCLLVTAANPYGFALWSVFTEGHNAVISKITEWKPFWEYPKLPVYAVVESFVLLAIAAVAIWRNRERRWSHIVWLLFLGASFLEARRQIWPLSIVCLAILAVNAEAILPDRLLSMWLGSKRGPEPRKGKSKKPMRPIPPAPTLPIDALRLAARAAVVGCLGFLIYSHHSSLDSWNPISPKLPEELINKIDLLNPPGKMFNDYAVSNFLEYHYGDSRPLFIDAINAYPASVTYEYSNIYAATRVGRKLLDDKGIDYVVLSDRDPNGDPIPLANYLAKSSNWIEEYSGYDGSLWIRLDQKTN